MTIELRADGLPLFESRPGAEVALFVDFDGGTRLDSRNVETYYGPASLDRDELTFDAEEQARIIDAVTNLADNYAAFDINVTTMESVREESDRWGALIVTNDYGARSGRAVLGSIGRSEHARGVAGTLGVLEPRSHEQPAYLLTHEFGHMFGLEHAGRHDDGAFEEYEEYGEGPVGAFMGGRHDRFDHYKWTRLVTERGDEQDPDEVLSAWAGYAEGHGALGDVCWSDEECRSGNCHIEQNVSRCRPRSCSRFDEPGDREFCELDACGPCRVGEGDCDRDSQCLSDAVCEMRDGVDLCL